MKQGVVILSTDCLWAYRFKSLRAKIKNFLTNWSNYDKVSELLATKRLRKTKIKKFLTIESDCDKLKKLSQTEKDSKKENKKSCWQTAKDMIKYQSCCERQRTLITEQWKTLKDSKRIIQANRKIWRTHLQKQMTLKQ